MAFVVASAAVHDLVRAPRRSALLVAVLPAAAYFEIEPPDAPGGGRTDGDRPDGVRMVALLARDAVRVPIGLVTALPRLAGPFAALRAGDIATIGDGELRVGDAEPYRPLRYWDPRVPRLRAVLASSQVRHRADALAGLAAGLAAGVVAHWLSAVDPLAAALADPVPRAGGLADGVRGLIGLGPGLTPAGDDVLAGALVALTAAGDEPRLTALAAEVRSVLSRTTPVSAALLGQACLGRTVPEVSDLLRALAGSGDLDAALARLSLVGHTSGAALALGVRLALRALDRHELGRVA